MARYRARIQVTNGKITDVSVPASPSGASKSVSIKSRAIPVLRTETLTAQRATVNTVSGAMYTTDGYRTSPQSALDQARAATIAAVA
jgi:uncharacterized protein with FMN-binding domain